MKNECNGFGTITFLTVMDLWAAAAESGEHRLPERLTQASKHLDVRYQRRNLLQIQRAGLIFYDQTLHHLKASEECVQ